MASLQRACEFELQFCKYSNQTSRSPLILKCLAMIRRVVREVAFTCVRVMRVPFVYGVVA